MGLDQIAPALAAFRSRLLALADGLSPEEWAGPSRCDLWTAHHVVRHIRDACRIHVTGLRSDPFWPFDRPIEQRASSAEWLSLSEGETPEQTLADLRRWIAAEGPALQERLERGDQDMVNGPYAPVPWTLLSLHAFWDAWVHYRDVAEITGGGTPSTAAEDPVVATYALFVASMAALFTDQRADATVALNGEGQSFVALVRPGHVELHPADAAATSADLCGRLDMVADSLAGRGPQLAEVLAGDSAKREPFNALRTRFNPPA